MRHGGRTRRSRRATFRLSNDDDGDVGEPATLQHHPHTLVFVCLRLPLTPRPSPPALPLPSPFPFSHSVCSVRQPTSQPASSVARAHRAPQVTTMPEPVSVLFVCLGNICRSTMAEGIFQHLAQQPPYKGKIGRIDSCGTGAWMNSLPLSPWPPQARDGLFRSAIMPGLGRDTLSICADCVFTRSCVPYRRRARFADAVDARGQWHRRLRALRAEGMLITTT